MLTFIKYFIEKNISKYHLSISLEDFELLGNEKVAISISSDHMMGSIEILKDLTTDLLIVEVDSEDIIYSKTYENIKNDDELKDIIQNYLEIIESYEKNN